MHGAKTPRAAPCAGGAFGMLPGFARQCLPCTARPHEPCQHRFSNLKYMKMQKSEKAVSVLFAARTLWCISYGKRDIGNQPLPMHDYRHMGGRSTYLWMRGCMFPYIDGNGKWQILYQLKQKKCGAGVCYERRFVPRSSLSETVISDRPRLDD